MKEINSFARYQPQMILNGFGEEAQLKLKHARVLVAGAGGLGCASLQYLAAAGIGTIGIADDDTVQAGNLHRQVLYTMQDVGTLKADAAAAWLMRMNPETWIHIYPVRLTSGNIADIIADYDIILDGTDNLETKYLINDACVEAGKPLVFAAVSQYEGQLAVFNYPAGSPAAANYRDIFPDESNNELSCRETGVLGVLPGIMGCMQSNETIKLITGIGKPLVNCLLIYNALTNRMNVFTVHPAGVIPTPTRYTPNEPLEINSSEFSRLINREDITVIDVRETNHRASRADFRHVHIPLSELQDSLHTITGNTVIAFCDHGILSLRAVKMLRASLSPGKKIYSLQKGISYWILNQLNKDNEEENNK